MNHFANGDNVADHGWVHVDGSWIEQIGVQVVSADKTAEANAGVFGQVFDRDRDGKRQREDPAEAYEPTVVAINKVGSPDSELISTK